jgi:hypothetical protein
VELTLKEKEDSLIDLITQCESPLTTSELEVEANNFINNNFMIADLHDLSRKLLEKLPADCFDVSRGYIPIELRTVPVDTSLFSVKAD